MKIVVPMAGSGDRFTRAGYKDPKPLIQIDGKPMIEHVVNMFPGERDFVFICSKEHLTQTGLRSVLTSLMPTGRIVGIDRHKLGPVHSVLQAQDYIEDDEEVFVSYCDYSAYWDYKHFLSLMHAQGYAGCITAYKGFHPHSLGNTYYAYMRHDDDNCMLEIKEKGCFTNNRMNEYASAGGYYFAKGDHVKKYFKELMDRGIAVNGEYYISMVYNLLRESGLKKIFVYELERFLQWGTPEDLEEYKCWSGYFNNSVNKQSSLRPNPGTNLIPMAGEGKRFLQNGYRLPKPMIPVDNEAMITRAVRSLPPAERWVFVCRREHVENYGIDNLLRKDVGGNCETITVDRVTEGQACTCLLAEPLLDMDKPLLIGACDCGTVWDEGRYADLLNDPRVDCIVWTFRNHVSSRRNPEMYGWVSVDGEFAKGVSVKVPISKTPEKDHAIVGVFYFRKARYFVEAARALIKKDCRINNEFYVDSCINELIGVGLKVAVFEVERYICWGTPNDVKTYEYWASYFRKIGDRNKKSIRRV